MLEREIERHLVHLAKQHGGLAIKWTAPSFSGVPDRIVFLPRGEVFFVELKAPTKNQTALQVRVCKMLTDLGARVYVVDSKQAVEALFHAL